MRNLSSILISIIALIIMIFLGFRFIEILTQPREGTVEQTWMEPAHWEQYQSGSTCVSYDTKWNCTMSIPIYSDRWIPDRCYIQINDIETTKRKGTWQIDCEHVPEIGKWVKV